MADKQEPKLKAPFCYFGGKSKIAHLVWQLLGDPHHYVEPFFGSGACLLGRPEERTEGGSRMRTETVNDLDCLLANFWRSVQQSPFEVAYWASYMVSEIDIQARHIWLVNNKARIRDGLVGDPLWCDPQAAGWWCYGISAWIGGGWCEKEVEPETRLPRLTNHGSGIEAIKSKLPIVAWPAAGVNAIRTRLPFLGSPAGGVNGIRSRLPYVTNPANGINTFRKDILTCDSKLEAITQVILRLADRLREVRVCSGDWSRLASRSLHHFSSIGYFLDPPYAKGEAGYAENEKSVAADVRRWCIENGDNPKLRIVLAGGHAEHAELEKHGYAVYSWNRRRGGYAKSQAALKRCDEQLWASPACFKLSTEPSEPAPIETTPEVPNEEPWEDSVFA